MGILFVVGNMLKNGMIATPRERMGGAHPVTCH